MKHSFNGWVRRFVFGLALVVTHALGWPATCNGVGIVIPTPPPPPPPPPPDFTITLSISPPDSGGLWTSTPAGMSNDTVRVVATPLPWTVFDNWSENGVIVSTAADYVFQLTTNRSLLGHFSPLYPPKCTILAVVSPPGAGAVALPYGPEFYRTQPAEIFVAGETHGFTFFNWTIDGLEVSKSPGFRFLVTNSCTLVANFRPFFTNTTVFTGVFARTNSAATYLGSLNLACHPSGHYRAALRVNNRKYNFSGDFRTGVDGFATVIYRNELWFNLQYSWSTGQFTNTVRYTMDDAATASPFVLERQQHNSSANLASGTGTYTLVLPGQQDRPEIAGDGYATMTVKPSGAVHITGALADGTKFSTAATVSENGRCPIFASLNGGKNVVAAWLDFTNESGAPSGEMIWLKAPKPRQHDGFTVSAPIIGSAYVPLKSPQPLLSLENELVTFEGGGYNLPLTQSAAFTAYNMLEIANGDSGNIVVSPGTGLFRGYFKDQASRRISFSGVVLQNYGVGRGYFLRDGQSGSVRLGN